MYPDLVGGIDFLLRHFIEAGWREDRNPCAEFDTNFYIRSFPKSITEGRCPVLYHLKVGIHKNYPTRFTGAITLPVTRAASRDFSNLKVAVHVHAFFVELFEEIVCALKSMPMPFHLLVTVASEVDKEFIENIIARTKCAATSEVVAVPPRGRDLAPLLVTARHLWLDYDYVCHVHTKKSPQAEFGAHWRHHLFDLLFGNKEIVSNIFGAFLDDPKIGMLFPENFYRVQKDVDWGRNADTVRKFLASFDIKVSELPNPAKFAAGSMAWYRTDALRAITAKVLTFDMFEEAGRQIDFTLAHAVERALPLAVEAAGFRTVPFYPEYRVEVDYGPMRHGAVRSDEPVVRRWLRDRPDIALNRPVPLKPLSSLYNPKCLDIHWITPDFGRGAGGHMTMLRIVELLGEFGHRQTIWIQNAFNHESPEVAKKRLQDWYRPIKDDVIVRFLPDDPRQLSGDVIIATDCWTVYPAVCCPNFKERFYFIQDFEPQFHPMGENYLVAEATYRMGLCAHLRGRLAGNQSPILRHVDPKVVAGVRSGVLFPRVAEGSNCPRKRTDSDSLLCAGLYAAPGRANGACRAGGVGQAWGPFQGLSFRRERPEGLAQLRV